MGIQPGDFIMASRLNLACSMCNNAEMYHVEHNYPLLNPKTRLL